MRRGGVVWSRSCARLLGALVPHLRERAAVAVQRRLLAGGLLPTLDGDIHVGRADLDGAATATGALGCDELRAASTERLEHHVAWFRVFAHGPLEQLDWLRARMLVADDASLAIEVD